jgi:ribonuclease VapC
VIVIDTSVLLAILNREPERQVFYEAIAASDRRFVSAVTYQEASQVWLARKGVVGLQDLRDLLTLIGAEIIPHDAVLAELAVEAFRRYGKGIDPKARLNFCDCSAYALAKSLDAALLFKGDDFVHTDAARS